MEYSPLNNLSSSGEDVVQYSLPVSASNSERPKKRRKRRDFDSLKAHTLHSAQQVRLCHCGSCAVGIVLVFLIVCISTLAVIVYYLSLNVGELQKHLDNLQVARGSVASSLTSLQSRLDETDKRAQLLGVDLRNLTVNLRNLTTAIAHHEQLIQAVNEEVKSISVRINQINHGKSSSVSLEQVQQLLATFGSELKNNVANIQQHDISMAEQIKELDVAIRNGGYQQSTNPSVKDILQQEGDMSQAILSVNGTCVSAVHSLATSLYDTNQQLHSYWSQTNTSIQSLEALVQSRLGVNNITNSLVMSGEEEITRHLQDIQRESRTNGQRMVDMAHHLNQSLATLMKRVDEIDIYLNSNENKVTEKSFVNKFENNLLNLTLTSGINEIITNAIEKEMSSTEQQLKGYISSTERQLRGYISRISDLDNRMTAMEKLLNSSRLLGNSTVKSSNDHTNAVAGSTQPSTSTDELGKSTDTVSQPPKTTPVTLKSLLTGSPLPSNQTDDDASISATELKMMLLGENQNNKTLNNEYTSTLDSSPYTVIDEGSVETTTPSTL